MVYLRLCAILVSTGALLAAADSDCVIEGKVVSLTTGQPLRKAEVTINVPFKKDNFTTVTDAEGKFSFEDLDPGEYEIGATRASYLDDDDEPSIEVAASQHIKGLVLKMTPQGILAGRVFDQDGDPVPKAGISIERFAGSSRKRRIESQFMDVDGEGAFKFTGLRPGRYLLVRDPQGTAGNNGRRRWLR